MGRRSRLAALAAVCALAGGCNSDDGGEPTPKPDPVRPPNELSREDGEKLLDARERIGQAARSVRVLSRSPAKARQVHGEVREVVASGALESNELDDFGKAALGDLGLAVPSLVERDADGVAESVDRQAVAAFLRHAEKDPARALVVPARESVDAIEETLKSTKAGTETKIPPRGTAGLDLTAPEYLEEAEGALAPTWPGLENRLRSLREELPGSAAS